MVPLAAGRARCSCAASMSTEARGARDCEAPDRGKTRSSTCASYASGKGIVQLPDLRPSGALTAIGLRHRSQLR